MKNLFKKIFLPALTAVMTACGTNQQEVTVYPIQDNVQPRIMARSLFNASDELVASLGLEDGVPASVCAFLIETQGVQILFDTANGASDSQLMPVLNSLEVAPDDIDYIFMTHLHGDHFGGLASKGADGTSRAAFRNAVVMIPQAEYDSWMSMPEEQTARLRGTLALYGDKVKTFGEDETLPYGITAIAAYGHTAGHTAYRIADVLIAGDVMHGVALQLENPEVCARFDQNQENAVTSRKALIELAKSEGLKMYGMHFPGPYYIEFN